MMAVMRRVRRAAMPAFMRCVGGGAAAPAYFSIILNVTAEKLPYPRCALGSRGDVLRPDAAAFGVDLAQHDQHLLGDDVTRDALALGLELVHVDPHRIERRGAL